MGALLSTAGTSPIHARHAARVAHCIIEVDPKLDVPGFGRERFEQDGWAYPTKPVFDWAMRYCDLYLTETND